MEVLSLCIPGHYGLYSAMLTLRQALALEGANLRWAAAGRMVARQALSAATAEDLAFGSLLATETDDDESRARALFDYIASEKPAVVLVNVFGGLVETNVVRYLPRHVRSILIVHNISRSTYLAARSVRGWVDAAVAISPRIRQDLIRTYGFRPEIVHTIPNSVALSVGQPEPPSSRAGTLRVLVHGRVEHSSKGVLWLPEIAQKALERGVNLELTVSGEGPDLARLRSRIACSTLAGRTSFQGYVERQRVPDLMRGHDVLLFPSVFEGQGLSLVEAMSVGCVPVASQIRGVTDYVVADGETGLLFPIGDTAAAADRLSALDRDRDRLRLMSEAAAKSVRARFSIEAQGAAFASLIRQVLAEPSKRKAPLPISRWQVPSDLRPGWWHSLPLPIKNLLRVTRERVQVGTA